MARTSRKISRIKQSAKYKYNKKKPTGSQKRSFKRKFTNVRKRKRTDSVVTPRRVRARTGSLPTPPSTGRRAVHFIRDVASAGAGAVYGAPAAIGTELAFRAGEGAYDYLTSTGNAGNTKVSSVGGSGMLAGAVRASAKQVSRNKYKPGTKVLSKFGMAQNGITTREEYRKVQSIYATGTTYAESRVIGHTSLPVRATYYNMWRSVLKKLLSMAGGNVDALTNLSGLTHNDGGAIRLVYYTNWLSTTPLTNAWTIVKPGGATGDQMTWKEVFDGYADHIMNAFDEDPRIIRITDIEYLPFVGTNGIIKFSRVRMSLPYTQICIKSKSMLKFQNQSGIWTSQTEAANQESDDITNIPIEVNMYYVTGNQFVHQHRKTSQTVGLNYLGFEDAYVQNQIGSEPAPAYEYVNCTGKTKFHMDPGHIKTSIISHNETYKFGDLIRMLVRKQDQPTGNKWDWNDNAMMKSLGHARAIHCDRVIGANKGTVKLLLELELVQQVACIGTLNRATDQYEVQTSAADP